MPIPEIVTPEKLSPSDCTVIARADHYEVVATGKRISSPKPWIDAWRSQESAGAQRVVLGIEGRHAYNSKIGGKASSASSVPARTQGARMAPAVIGGLTPDATIFSVGFRPESGEIGETTWLDLAVEPNGTNHFGFQVDQDQTSIQGGMTLARLTGDGMPPSRTPGTARANWFCRPCSSLQFLVVIDCRTENWDEYGLAYWDNVIDYVALLGNTVDNCGRGGVQGTNRLWHDAAQTKPTHLQPTSLEFELLVQSNLFRDCASYWDAAKQKWQANGAALTLCDLPGQLTIKRNQFVHTHAGSAQMFVGHDAKAGTLKTAAGNRVGIVTIDRNEFRNLGGAMAQREALMLGAMDRLELRQNTIDGSLTGVLLNHTGRIASYDNVEHLSDSAYWGKTATKMVDDANDKHKLSDAEIDAL